MVRNLALVPTLSANHQINTDVVSTLVGVVVVLLLLSLIYKILINRTMKTSRKIFIGFMSFLVLILIPFAFPAKDSDGKIAKNGKVDYVENVDSVPSFNCLLVEKGCKVYLKKNDSTSAYFSFYEHKDSVPSHAVYEMRGDTLVVSSTQNSKGNGMDLFCDNPDDFIVEGHLFIKKGQPHITVVINRGKLELSGGGYELLDVNSTDGELQYRGVGLQSVKAHLVNSKFIIRGAFLLNAHIIAKSNSEIRLQRSKNMVLERDGTCKYYEMN